MEIIDILSMKNVFRLVVLVLLFGHFMFTFFLMMKIRILSKTLKAEKVELVYKITQIHALITFIGSLLAGILILF